jgi:prenylated cyclic peptide (anacyclamide/piricyclamide family)
MTKKNLKPQQATPVQRENTATVARDGNAIAPSFINKIGEKNYMGYHDPFAGDDAE